MASPYEFTRPPREDLLWLAVDLDGTLAEGIWTPGNPTSGIGAPIKENVAKLREAAANGWKVVIHTARSWTDYEAIEAWWELHLPDVPLRGIVCGKILAHRYIDDRAINADADRWW